MNKSSPRGYLRKEGFTAPQNKRDIYILILNEANQIIAQNQIDKDWRNWTPDLVANSSMCIDNFDNPGAISSMDNLIIGGIPLGEQHSQWHHTPLSTNYQPYTYSLESDFNISTLQDGNYKIGVLFPDQDPSLNSNSNYSVKFANQTSYLKCNGVTILAGFTIGYSTTLDSDADGFIDTDDTNPFNPIEISLSNQTSNNIQPCESIHSLHANSIKSSKNKINLNLYPNPASNIIYTDIEYTDAWVLDLTGNKIIHDKSFENGVDISKLNSGIYILQVKKGNQYVTSKFMKFN